MCVACATGAATAVGAAAGIRAWIAANLRERIGDPGVRAATALLMLAAVLLAGGLFAD